MSDFLYDNIITVIMAVIGWLTAGMVWLWSLARWVSNVEAEASSAKEEIEAMKKQHERDWKALAAQIHEDKMERLRDRSEIMDHLREMRTDVKALLSKVGDGK
jgi:hypothetical protein